MSDGAETRKAVANDYHCATLVGNWQEERRTFGEPAPTTKSGMPIDANTTYTTSYTKLSNQQVAGAKPSSCFAGEAPKELIFYHGDCAKPEKNCYTVTELSYTDRKADPTTNEEVLHRTGVSQRQNQTSTLRQTMGLSGKHQEGSQDGDRSEAMLRETQHLRSLNGAEKAEASADRDGQSDAYRPPSIPPVGRVEERNRMMTTKNVTTDATGEYLKTNLEHYPLTSSECVGELVHSRNDPMHNTKLRVQYKADGKKSAK